MQCDFGFSWYLSWVEKNIPIPTQTNPIPAPSPVTQFEQFLFGYSGPII